jgi:excinuclease ABC subunit C
MKGLVELLESEMNDQAAKLNFEEAASYRDQIAALERYSQKQRIVSADFVDRDVFGLSVDREHDVACGVVFKVRDGKVIGSQHKVLRRIEGVSESSLIQTFAERFYSEATFFPDEVLLAFAPEDIGPLSDYLREQQGKLVPIKIPERGDKAGLVRLVNMNASHHVEEWIAQKSKQAENRIPHAVESLQKDLRLKAPPRRMECFDISHLAGTGTVASCVVFFDGKARPSEYRTFKIRDVDEGSPDDFASMREVVSRRYRRLIDENKVLPDLVIIDGGKGQLSSAETALKDIDAYGLFPIVGLAKRLEEVFFPHDTDPVLIPRASASLQLLQRIRNEAHRFAITFQRKQRKKSTLRTELTSIPGIGPATVKKLLTQFGSVKRVKEASREDLEACVGRSAAEKLIRNFASETLASDNSK